MDHVEYGKRKSHRSTLHTYHDANVMIDYCRSLFFLNRSRVQVMAAIATLPLFNHIDIAFILLDDKLALRFLIMSPYFLLHSTLNPNNAHAHFLGILHANLRALDSLLCRLLYTLLVHVTKKIYCQATAHTNNNFGGSIIVTYTTRDTSYIQCTLGSHSIRLIRPAEISLHDWL